MDVVFGTSSRPKGKQTVLFIVLLNTLESTRIVAKRRHGVANNFA